jgi:hypothetical protein
MEYTPDEILVTGTYSAHIKSFMIVQYSYNCLQKTRFGVNK